MGFLEFASRVLHDYCFSTFVKQILQHNMNPLAPWKEYLKKIITENIKQNKNSTYMQLATLNRDGTPANRTVVFRGFAGEDHNYPTGWESDLISFTTDIRSDKIAQIQVSPKAEICWYLPVTNTQFRLTGNLHLITHKDSSLFSSFSTAAHLQTHFRHLSNPVASFDWEHERLRQWSKIPSPLRANFTWPQPGGPRNDDGKEWIKQLDADEEGAEIALRNFAVVVMEVFAVDIVILEESMNYRRCWKKTGEGGWELIEMNP